MKDKKISKIEKIVITIIICILIIVVIAGIIINIKNRSLKKIVEEFDIIYEDGVKINTSEELAKTKVVDNLELTNIILSYTDGISTLLGNLTNKGAKKTEETSLNIEMLDKEENVIAQITTTVRALNPGETAQLNANINADIAGAYNFRISK